MILRNVHALIFAESDALAAAAEAAVNDPRLSRSRLDVQRGGVLAAAEWLAHNPSPDVLIVSDAVDETMWERMEVLADAVEPHCRVIVIGPSDHIAIYRELTSRGVADYLGGEIAPGEIVDAICRLFVAEEGMPKGKVVVVTSAVGGAGGSTVAAALSSSLGRRLSDAILLDLDLPTGTAALMMGIDPRDPLSSALANPGLDAALLERFMAREGAVRVLSTPGALREARYVDGESAERLLQVARAMAKVVVVDLPKGWGEMAERLVSLADEVVVVARPDLASLRNTRMIVDDVAGRRIDGRRAKVVVNFVGAGKKNEYGTSDFAEAGGAVPGAMIPFDPDPLLTAVAEGRPIAQAGGKAMAAILGFAETLLVADGAKPATKRKSALAGMDVVAAVTATLARLRARKKEKV